MRTCFLIFILFLSLCELPFSYGQNASVKTGIRGKITDTNGRPLPFASITIHGTTIGTLSNSEGVYDLPLGKGDYTVHFQYLGFKTTSSEVSVDTDKVVINPTLHEQALTLHELQVGKEAEDPAYTIMRKAISKARYHQLQIQSYSASVYARSTALPTKIPVLMRKRLKKQGISENVGFVNESITKVDYKRPNSYTQTIVSTQNNLDNNTPTPNEFIFASFYNPEVGGAVSPLSPKALNVYQFEYEGYFEDRGEIINKIKVTPKSYKQGVFKGSIYIIDEKWAIHSFNLQTIWQGFDIRVKQVFSPMQRIWVPGNQHFDINGSYLGFAGKFTYVVSIQYDKLSVDPALSESIAIVDPRREPDVASSIPAGQNLEDLLEKGKKTDTKSFRKIVRQYEKEQRKRESPDTSPREVRRDSIVVEPLANKRDSSYWASMRTVPLTGAETISYHISDSISSSRSPRVPSGTDSTKLKAGHLLTGARYRYGSGRSLSFKSPVRSLNFNPAEAFHLNLDVEWQRRYPNKARLTANPMLHYSTGRNRLSPALKLQFAKDKFNLVTEGGEAITQFNSNDPIPPLVNTFYYLFLNQNHIRLYQKRFVSISYRQREVFEVIDLRADLETGKRSWLKNLDNRGRLLKGDPQLERNENIPYYQDYPSFFPEEAADYTVFSLRLDISPWRRYLVRNGRKQFFSSQQPVFNVEYRKGIPIGKSDVDYDFLEAGVRYEPKVFAASSLQLSATAGRFFNNRSLTIPDFKHFMGNQTVIQTGDRLSSFRMLPYYQFSTARNFIQAHISFNSPKLLLTQFHALRLAGIKEYIQGHMLRTPNTPFYTEQVYGIDGLLKLFRIEVVTHFNQDIYLGTGFRIGTILNLP